MAPAIIIMKICSNIISVGFCIQLLPAFAVIPYDQFKTFIDRKDDEVTIPHEVARAATVYGKSMLQAWREYKGLTQSEPGEKLVMSQSAIAQFEDSISTMREATLKKFADTLDIEIDQLREL